MRKTRTILVLLCITLFFVACEEEPGQGVTKARELLDSGQPRKAFALADSLLDEDANNMDAVLVAAEALYEIGDHGQSIYYLGEYLQARSTSAEAFLLRAKNYRAKGKKKEAYTDLEAAVKYDPGLHEAVELLLTDYYRDYNWDAWLDRLWDLEKLDYEGGLFFGMCSIRASLQGKNSSALEYADKAIEAAPGEGMEYFKAKIYMEKGEPDKALKWIEKAAYNPIRGGSVSSLQGLIYLQQDNHYGVEACLAALRSDGLDAEAAYLEGRKLMRQGDFSSARKVVEESEMNPTHREAMVQYLEAKMGIGLFGTDDVYIESGNPFFIEALCFNAFWNLEADNNSEAEDIIEEACKLNPEHALALYVRGLIKAREGDTDGYDDLKKARENNVGIIYGDEFGKEIQRLCD